MKSLRTLIALTLCTLGIFTLSVVRVRAQEKSFSEQELSQFDGKDGHPAYFAYKGKVYDVSTSTLWKLGEHFGVHAGFDLTGKMEGAPHGDEVLSTFPVVGTYALESAPTTTVAVQASAAPVAQTPPTQSAESSWYDAPIRIAGISILGWTGILLGVVFALNFLTCFALPWGKLPVPWAGARPGPDALDKAPVHKNLASIHKYFAWATVVIGILHGVIGLMQVFLKMYL